jgi:hypothetical protein
MSNDGWTKVETKKKPKNQTKVKVEVVDELKGFRRMKSKDYTLSEEEKEMLKGHENLFCYCCCVSEISKIIGRKLYSCGTCYCCSGDDPAFDMGDLEMWVNDQTGCVITRWVNEEYSYDEDYYEYNDDGRICRPA